jgi:hypothetical protein
LGQSLFQAVKLIPQVWTTIVPGARGSLPWSPLGPRAGPRVQGAAARAVNPGNDVVRRRAVRRQLAVVLQDISYPQGNRSPAGQMCASYGRLARVQAVHRDDTGGAG